MASSLGAAGSASPTAAAAAAAGAGAEGSNGRSAGKMPVLVGTKHFFEVVRTGEPAMRLLTFAQGSDGAVSAIEVSWNLKLNRATQSVKVEGQPRLVED